MSKIIYDTIKKYSEADILLPAETIEEVTEIIADELNVSDYIKGVHFVNESVFAVSYYLGDKTIHFNYGSLNEYVNNTLKQNLFYLFCLLHEINHAKQLKFYSENSFDLLNDPLDKYKYLIYDEFFKIMSLTKGIRYHHVYNLDEIEHAKKMMGENFDSNFPVRFNFFYRLYHDSFIPEREADIEAYDYVLNLLNVNSDSSELINYYKNELNRKKLEMYRNYNGKIDYDPIKIYLYDFGYDELNENIMNLKCEINSAYPELPLDIRMEYGLDITPDEYNNIQNIPYNNRIERKLKSMNNN